MVYLTTYYYLSPLITLGTCKYKQGISYCCDKSIDASSCYWNEGKVTFPGGACSYSEKCADGEERITLDEYGGQTRMETHTNASTHFHQNRE
jgi:hypothetical protein